MWCEVFSSLDSGHGRVNQCLGLLDQDHDGVQAGGFSLEINEGRANSGCAMEDGASEIDSVAAWHPGDSRAEPESPLSGKLVRHGFH